MRKKIALINGSLGGGGAERFTVTLANALQKDAAFQLFLITAQKQKNEYRLDECVNRYCILKDRFLKDILSIRYFLKTNTIDTAVAIGIYANLVLCVANVFLKTKVIISERNDPKHDSLSMVSKILRKLLYWRADGFVFQTKGAQSFYSRSIQKRSVVVHNPIMDNVPYKSNVCNKEIVAVGRLMPQKNYPLLLQAFAQVVKNHPDYTLRIFGQGILLEELQMLSEELCVADKVVFEGFSDHVHESIKDSDIFVMSSDFEGMPNSLMEAMAMGFPVISTDCPSGGPAELIQNGENGLLVQVGDATALAKAMETLITDQKLKQQLSKNAVTLRKTHSVDKIVSSWKKIV